MTFTDAVKIANQNRISPSNYRINGNGAAEADTVSYLDYVPNGFRYHITDRGSIVFNRVYKTEDEACKAFLNDFGVEI